MKSLLEIPLNHYHTLLAKCAFSDGERSILENGIVLQDEQDGRERRVAILCDSDEAKKIIDVVSRLRPEASCQIREFTALNDC